MIELLSIDADLRLNSYCLNARASYEWFKAAVRGAERNLTIQRGIIGGTKSYATLRADLRRGCVLPPIVLAVKNVQLPGVLAAGVNTLDPAQQSDALEALSHQIATIAPANLYIIDGLQRTNAIIETADELNADLLRTFMSQRLRLELWLNIPFGAMAYRMLLLNAGQRPMSIKHQVEILSMKLGEELAEIPCISVFTSLEGRRRTQPGQFQLAKLAQAFQAWLQGHPNLDLRNTVMEQLLAESAIETLGSSLGGERIVDERDSFRSFVAWLVALDIALGPDNVSFLGSETVLLGIAAAVGAAERNPTVQERMRRSIETLLTAAQRDGGAVRLALDEFDAVRRGIDPARSNVGVATRDLVFGAFQEYFLSDGTKPMSECWRFGAARI